MRSGLLAFVLVVLSGVASRAEVQDATLEHLREFQARVEAPAKKLPPKLSDEDLDLLEAAQIDQESLTGGDLATMVVILRFGKSLKDEELPTVEEFGASEEGRPIAGLLAFILVDRKRMDGVARLLVASARGCPREQRSYSTAKFWETSFGIRADFHTLSRDLSLALLKRFEGGGAEERLVIADLFDKEGMTAADLPALREEIAERWKQQEEASAAEAASEPARIWIEDRKGLRQVDPRAMRGRPFHHTEIRLAKPGEPGSPPIQWGKLVGNEYDGDAATAMLAFSRDLAALAHDPFEDFDSGVGPIAIFSRGDDEPYELRRRRGDLGTALSTAIGACSAAAIAAHYELPPQPARDERIATIARDVLAAAREAASRMGELATEAAWVKPPDAAGDAAVLARLRAAAADAFALLAEMRTQVLAPVEPGSWRDMPYHYTQMSGSGGREEYGRTHVAVTNDVVAIVEFGKSADTALQPGYTGVKQLSFGRGDLRDATFEDGDDMGPELPPLIGACSIKVVTKANVPTSWIDFGLDPKQGALVRRGGVNRTWIPCDTDAHRKELVAELRRFAAGGGR